MAGIIYDSLDSCTPLHQASITDDLKDAFPVDSVNSENQRELDLAIKRNKIDVIDLLLNSGAKLV